MGVQTLFMLVGDIAPPSWPPYVMVAASHGESFAAGPRAGLALDLASLLQFTMEMSKVCGLAGMLFVLKLPLATVDDIVVYTDQISHSAGFSQRWLPSSW